MHDGERFGIASIGIGLCILGCVQTLLYCVGPEIDWRKYTACGMGWTALFLLFLVGACMFLIYILWYVMREMGK